MTCVHCGATKGIYAAHICQLALIDWLGELDPQPGNFQELSECYDNMLCIQVGPMKPGLHVPPLGTYV